MFNKTNKPARVEKPQAAPLPPVDVPGVNLTKKPVVASMGGGPKAMSSVGAGLVIDGNVTGQGDLHLDGTVHGDVKVGHLTVGESGNIEGKVEAETVEVRGRVVGSIQGRQIKLQATAYVEGDITHEQLAIDVGAFFQGRCLQTRRVDPNVSPVLSSPSAMSSELPSSVPSPASSGLGAPSLGAYDMNALADLK